MKTKLTAKTLILLTITLLNPLLASANVTPKFQRSGKMSWVEVDNSFNKTVHVTFRYSGTDMVTGRAKSGTDRMTIHANGQQTYGGHTINVTSFQVTEVKLDRTKEIGEITAKINELQKWLRDTRATRSEREAAILDAENYLRQLSNVNVTYEERMSRVNLIRSIGDARTKLHQLDREILKGERMMSDLKGALSNYRR